MSNLILNYKIWRSNRYNKTEVKTEVKTTSTTIWKTLSSEMKKKKMDSTRLTLRDLIRGTTQVEQ